MRKIFDLNRLPSGRWIDLNWHAKQRIFEATLVSSNGNRLRSDYGCCREMAVKNLIQSMLYSSKVQMGWEFVTLNGERVRALFEGEDSRHGKYLKRMAEELKTWLGVA